MAYDPYRRPTNSPRYQNPLGPRRGQPSVTATIARDVANFEDQQESMAREQARAAEDARKAQEQAAEDAANAARDEDARRTRELAAAGAETTTDIETGRRTIATHDDGKPKWKPGPLGEPAQIGGKWTQKFRNDRGEETQVDIAQDPSFHKVDERTGEKYFEGKDGFGKPRRISLGYDEEKRKKIDMDQRFTREKAGMVVERERLTIDEQAVDNEYLPVARERDELNRVKDEHQKGLAALGLPQNVEMARTEDGKLGYRHSSGTVIPFDDTKAAQVGEWKKRQDELLKRDEETQARLRAVEERKDEIRRRKNDLQIRESRLEIERAKLEYPGIDESVLAPMARPENAPAIAETNAKIADAVVTKNPEAVADLMDNPRPEARETAAVATAAMPLSVRSRLLLRGMNPEQRAAYEPALQDFEANEGAALEAKKTAFDGISQRMRPALDALGETEDGKEKFGDLQTLELLTGKVKRDEEGRMMLPDEDALTARMDANPEFWTEQRRNTAMKALERVKNAGQVIAANYPAYKQAHAELVAAQQTAQEAFTAKWTQAGIAADNNFLESLIGKPVTVQQAQGEERPRLAEFGGTVVPTGNGFDIIGADGWTDATARTDANGFAKITASRKANAAKLISPAAKSGTPFFLQANPKAATRDEFDGMLKDALQTARIAASGESGMMRTGYEADPQQSAVSELIQARGLDIESVIAKVGNGTLSVQQGNALLTAVHGKTLADIYPDTDRLGTEEHFREFLKGRPDLLEDISGLGANKAKKDQLIDAYVSHLGQSNAGNPFFPPSVRQDLRVAMQSKTTDNFWSVTVPETAAQAIASTAGIAVGLGQLLWTGNKALWGEELSAEEKKRAGLVFAQTKTAQEVLRRNLSNIGEGKDNGLNSLGIVARILDGRDSHDLTPEMEEEVKTLLAKAAREAVEGKMGIGEVGNVEDYDLWNNVTGRALLDEYMATGSDSAFANMKRFLDKNEEMRLVEDAAQNWISSKATAKGMNQKMQQAFFGGSVAPLQEFGTEIIGDALMFVGVGVSAKTAQTAMKVETTRKAAQRALSMAAKIKEGVNKARAATYFRVAPGKPLAAWQKAANVAQAVGRGAVKGGVVEGFEETLAVTFSEVNPDSADFAKSFEEGFIGGVALAGGMGGVMGIAQVGMQEASARRNVRNEAEANRKFADFYNANIAKGDASLAITPELAEPARIAIGQAAPRFVSLSARLKGLQEIAGDQSRPMGDRMRAAALAGRTTTQLSTLEEATAAKIHLAVEAAREIQASPAGGSYRAVLKLASGGNFTEADNAALGKLSLEDGSPVVEVVESVNDKGERIQEWKVTDAARAQIAMDAPMLGQLIETSESVKILEAKLEASARQAAGLPQAEATELPQPAESAASAAPAPAAPVARVPMAQAMQAGPQAVQEEIAARIKEKFPSLEANGIQVVVSPDNFITGEAGPDGKSPVFGVGGGMNFYTIKGKPVISIHPAVVSSLEGFTPEEMERWVDAAIEEEADHAATKDALWRMHQAAGGTAENFPAFESEKIKAMAAEIKAADPKLYENSAKAYHGKFKDGKQNVQWDTDTRAVMEIVRAAIQKRRNGVTTEEIVHAHVKTPGFQAFLRSVLQAFDRFFGSNLAEKAPVTSGVINATEARLQTYEQPTTAQDNGQNVDQQGQVEGEKAPEPQKTGVEPGQAGRVDPEAKDETQEPLTSPGGVQYAADGTYQASTPRAGMSVPLARPGPVELESIESSAGTNLQPRDRSRPANRHQEQKIAANWNPARATAVPTTDSGPIIYADNGQSRFNLSGHGRQNAQRILYTDPALQAKAQENREWIKAEMGRLGYAPEEIAAVDSMKMPVWAAEIVDLGDYASRYGDMETAGLAFVRDSNIYGMSPGELAISDAAILQRHKNGDLLMRLRVSESGSYTLKQLGNDATLSEILELFGAGNEYTDNSGNLNQAFEDRLDNAMLAVALGNQSAETITGLVEGQEGTINIRKGIITAAPELAKLSVGGAFDIGKEVIGPALKELAGFRAAKKAGTVERLSEYLAQMDFTRKDDPRVSRILDAIADGNRKPSALGEILVEISRDELRKKLEADAYGDGLFGPMATPARLATPEASIQALAGFAGENSKPAQAYRALLPLVPSMPEELKTAVAQAALYEEGRIRNGIFTAKEFHQQQGKRLEPLAMAVHRFMDGATPQAAGSLVRRFQFAQAQSAAPLATPARVQDTGTADLFGNLFPDQPAVKPRNRAADLAAKAPPKGKQAIAKQIATTEQFSPEAADLFAMAAAGMIDNSAKNPQNQDYGTGTDSQRNNGNAGGFGDLFNQPNQRDSGRPDQGQDGNQDPDADGRDNAGDRGGDGGAGLLREPDGSQEGNDQEGSTGTLRGESGKNAPAGPVTPAKINRPPPGDPERNAVIDPTRSYAPKAGRARFEANIKAIRLMRQIEEENRTATTEEKEQLLAYTGWGWLKEAFNKVRAGKYERMLAEIRELYDYTLERYQNATGYYRPDHPGPWETYLDNKLKSRQNASGSEAAATRRIISWADSYHDFYKEIREALTDEEFDAAAKSVRNAHYTDVPIIGAIWDLAAHLGFKGGRATEPGAGIGHFIGAMPADLADRTIWNAVELDTITARILSHLYPEANVNGEAPRPGRKVSGLGFQAARIPNNSQDLVISNVPFAKEGPGQSSKEFGIAYNLHNYFFARAFSKAKPGGLVIFITSASTLDNNYDQRQALGKMADLVGAIRLPNNAFKANAGTEVTTDILVFRKPDGGPVNFTPQQWAYTAELEKTTITSRRPESAYTVKDWLSEIPSGWVPTDPEIAPLFEEWRRGKMPATGKKMDALYSAMKAKGMASSLEFTAPVEANEYWKHNPSHAIGKHSLAGSMYQADAYALIPDERAADIPAAMREIIATFPANVMGSQTGESGMDTATAATEDKMGSFVERDGKIWQVEPDGLVTPEWAGDPKKVAMFRSWANVRAKFNELIRLELAESSTDAQVDAARNALNTAYEAHRVAYGALATVRANKLAFLQEDPDYIPLQALENIIEDTDKKGKRIYTYEKADIFKKRAVKRRDPLKQAETLEEAILASMVVHGRLVPSQIAESLGKPVETIEAELLASPYAYKNPLTGVIEIADQYLSGNVGAKLAAAKLAMRDDPAMEKNVKALTEVQPAWQSIGQIGLSVKSVWIPPNVVAAFAEQVLGLQNVSVVRVEGTTYISSSGLGNNDYRGGGWTAHELLEAILRDETIEVKVTEGRGADKRTYVSPEATAAAKAAAAKISEAFVTFAKTSDAQIENESGEKVAIPAIVEAAFNEKVSGWRPPTYDGSWITLPGQSGEIYLDRGFRRNVLARLLTLGYGMVAHGVGSGKTLTQVALAMELRRLGKAKKPVIIVEKSTLGQFAAAFRRAYPQAKLLVAGDTNFGPQDRARFLARMKTGDWDTVIMTRPQVSKIPHDQTTVQNFFARQLAALDAAIAASDDASDRQGAIQRRRDALEEKMIKMQEKMAENQDRFGSTWEELGVDALIIDEAHNYKNTSVITRLQDLKGLPTSVSQQAVGMELKTADVRARNSGKGIFMATGTPVSNTMGEAWIMLNFIAPGVLQENGITTFDEFADTYGAVVSNPEATWKGEVRDIARFAKFVNGRALIDVIRSVFDVAIGNEKLGLDVPRVRGGKPETIVLDETPAMQLMNDWVVGRLVPAYHDVFGEKDDEGQYIQQPMSRLRDYLEANKWVNAVPIMTMQAGIAAALDPRLIHDLAPDDPGSKVNQVVEQVYQRWLEGKDRKTAQVIFSDLAESFNMDHLINFVGEGPFDSLGKNEGKFNLYEDIAAKLVAKGIPREEIGWLPKQIDDERKEKFFDKVNDGTIRVLIGGQRIATGVNFQERLAAAYHLMPPRDFKPAMMEQRNGRIIRQGNMHAEWAHDAYVEAAEAATGQKFTGKNAFDRRKAAEKWMDENNATDAKAKAEEAASQFDIVIVEFGMAKSLDSAIYSTMSAKQGFIGQVLSGEVNGDFEDPTDQVAMDMAEMAAHTIGDPDLIRKIELDRAFRKLNQERQGFENRRAELLSNQRNATANIRYYEEQAAQMEAAAKELDGLFDKRKDEKGNSTPLYELEGGETFDSTIKGGITAPINRWLLERRAASNAPTVVRSITVNGVKFDLAIETPLPGDEGIPVTVTSPLLGNWATKTKGASGLLMALRRAADFPASRINAAIQAVASNTRELSDIERVLETYPREYPQGQELAAIDAERRAVKSRISARKAAESEARRQRNEAPPTSPAPLATPARVDPRLAKVFGKDVKVDPIFGMPQIPRVLSAQDPLLRETHKLESVTVEKGDELSRLGILRPGTYPRPKMHDAIVRHILSQGKALPDGMQPTVFFSGGGGGAGKTTILKDLKKKGLLQTRGAIEINADDIKALIPEYDRIAQTGDGRAAPTVHEESSVVAKLVLAEVLKPAGMAGWGETAPAYNVIYDATLANFDKVVPILDKFKRAGFRTHLIGVTVDPQEALIRAFIRGADSRRFVGADILMEAHIGFNRSLPGYLPLFDRVDLVDNTPPEPHPIGRKTNGKEFAITDQVWYDKIGERSQVQNPSPGSESSEQNYPRLQGNPQERGRGGPQDQGQNEGLSRGQGQGEVNAPLATPARVGNFSNLREDLAAQRDYFRDRMEDMGFQNEADIDEETFAKWAREWREMNPRTAPDGSILYTPTRQDAVYFEALDRNDEKAARDVLLGIADKNGYDLAMYYHGTESVQAFDDVTYKDNIYYGTQAGDWTVPHTGKIGAFYVTPSAEGAEEYSLREGLYSLKKGRVLSVFLKRGNFFNPANKEHIRKLAAAIPKDKIESSRKFYDELKPGWYGPDFVAPPRWHQAAEGDLKWSTYEDPEIIALLKSLGFEGYKVEDTTFGSDKFEIDAIGVFNPAGFVKSAETVTRNEAGDIIPPSQRFNPESPSILFTPAKASPEPPDADLSKAALERALGELPPAMRRVWAELLKSKGNPEAAAKATGLSVNAVENIIRIIRGRAIALDLAAKGQKVPTQDGKLFAGRPDLALSSNPVVAQVDASRNLEGSPSWRPRDIVIDEAKARLAADYNGTFNAMLEKARKVEPMSDTDVATVKLILAKETAGGALDNRARAMDLAELIFGYREIGSDTARSLAMRFDPHHNPADRAAQFLAEGFLSPDPKTRKLMQKAKTAAERQLLLQSWMNRVEGLRQAMKARGIDVQALLAQHAAVQQKIQQTDAANPAAARFYQIQIAKLSPQDRAILETARALQLAGQRDMRLVMARAAAAGAVDETYAVARYRKFQADLAAEMRAVAKQAAQVVLGTPGVTDAEMAILEDIGFGSLDEAYEEDNRPRKTPGKKKPAKSGKGKAAPAQGTNRPYVPVPGADPRTSPATQQPLAGLEGQPNDITGDYDLTNPEVLNALAQALGGARGTWIDGLFEFWKASILSGPKTQIVNIVSTAAYGVYETTIRRAAEGAANDLLKLVGLGSKDAATTGELAVIFHHLRQAAGRAIRNGIHAWKTESRVFNDQALGLAKQLDFATVKGEASQRFQADPTTGLGKLANLIMAIVRMPSFRLMGMTDEILKTFFGHLEAAAQSHRIAKAEGLKGEAYAARHAELMAYGSAAWVRAHDHALKVSFQTELGTGTDAVSQLIDPIARQVQTAAQKVPVLQFIVPFITTPTNLAKNAITLSPAGLFFHAVDMVRALKARYGNREIPVEIRKAAAREIYDRARLISDLTQQLIAWGVAYSLVGMAEDDDEDGLPALTGSVPAKGTVQRGERDLSERTMPPYTIKLGGYWLDYSRLDPFSTVLAAIADYAHAKRQGKEGADLASHMAGKTLAAMKDKTFLSGISDLMHAYDDAVAAKSGGYGIQSYIARTVTGFVPNLIRQPIQMADSMKRDTREIPEDVSFLEGLAMRAGYMLAPQSAPVKLDVWGRPMPKTQAAILGEPGDALLRLTWPGGITANAAEKVLPIDKWILSYQRNRGEGDPTLAFEIPERNLTYTLDGKRVTVSMSQEDHADFIQSAGKDALAALQGQNAAAWSDWKNPSADKAKMVKDVMEDIRAGHRARMKAKYLPEAMKKAAAPRQ